MNFKKRAELTARLAELVLTVTAVAGLTFILMRFAPGGPYSSERSYGAGLEPELAKKYGVRGSFISQYLRYTASALTFDFGPSLKYRDVTVGELLRDGLPVSAALGLTAFLFALAAGLATGTAAGLSRNRRFAAAAGAVSMLGLSMPVFAAATLAVSVFSFKLRLFPVAGWGMPVHLVLPAAVLALPAAASISGLFATAVRKTRRKEFVSYAAERGLSKKRIFFRYILPEALRPVVSYSGPALAGLMTGSVVIENIFAIPGIGTHFVNAALNRDYTLLFGVVTVYSTALVTLNFLSDALLRKLDRSKESA